MKSLSKFVDNDYFNTLGRVFKNPLYQDEAGLDAMQLALSPLAIARIHKTLIEFLLSENLSLNVEFWNIAVIERDVPCAYLAFQDFKNLLTNIFALASIELPVPEFKLTIYHTDEFEDASLNKLQKNLISHDCESLSARCDIFISDYAAQNRGRLG